MSTVFRVRDFEHEDLPHIAVILSEYVRDETTRKIFGLDIIDILSYMFDRVDKIGRQRKYLVACDDHNNVCGFIGYMNPDPVICDHFHLDYEHTLELCNFFALVPGMGIGTTLYQAACLKATELGKTYIVGAGGPRYAHSWSIYDHWGQRLGVITDYHTRQIDQVKRDATIWGLSLI